MPRRPPPDCGAGSAACDRIGRARCSPGDLSQSETALASRRARLASPSLGATPGNSYISAWYLELTAGAARAMQEQRSRDPAGRFRVGLVQMCSGREVEGNIADASRLVREAAARGAQYVQ